MHVLQDFRESIRTVRKSPGFTIMAVITLGIGIGLISAIYSVCNAMLWRPAALPHLENLVMVLQTVPGVPDEWNELTPADFDDIQRSNTFMQHIASWRTASASLVIENSTPQGVLRTIVSANFFDVAGVTPYLGRAFEPGEDQLGHDQEVILSYRLWRETFGSDLSRIGKTVRVDGQTYSVIGVMPESFNFPLATDIWTPNALTPEQRASRQANMMVGMARLKPGATIENASSEIDAISARLEQTFADTNKNRRFTVRPAHRFLVNYQRQQYLLMLLTSGAFVLLIACANLANLQFARSSGRLREVAVRSALGASRWRVISQLLSESMLVSLLGAALGLALGKWVITVIKGGMPSEIQKFVLGWKNIDLDGRVLVFTVLVSVVSGILAGLAPAWQISRPNLVDALSEGGRGGTTGRSRHRLRSLLVATEIIFAVVLLAGAGLMVRGFRAQVETGGGMEPSTLLTLRLALPASRYAEPHQIVTFYRDTLDRIATLPGVRSAAAVTALPYSGHSNGQMFTIENRQVDPNDIPRAMYQVASPSYFKTLNIGLISGRLLNDSDGPDATKVAVISKRAAAYWWQNESPIGKRIQVGTDSNAPWATIVGVVDDVVHSPYDRQPRRTIYVPYQQAPSPWMDIGVRTVNDPLSAGPAIATTIRQIDAAQPISGMQTMETAIHNSSIGLNYMAVLMGVFGLTALGLSMIGVYGVMAQVVSEQNREIGIRMALGAQRGNVMQMVFGRGMLTVGTGLILGVILAWGFSHLLASVIYGVAAGDAATFVGIPVVLLLVAGLAIYIPARRATRVDPIVVLR